MPLDTPEDEMDVATLAERINEAALGYRVSGLQQLRARLHGKRARTQKLFTKSTIFPDDEYAFHDGGRTELQFNIGVEQREASRYYRHGVAFSFETSRSLPDHAVLAPKVRRFNEWVRANGEVLWGFKMWDWGGPTPSADRPPGEILASSMKTGTFVFLGTRVPESSVDIDRILYDFDRLYPLYTYVESGAELEDSPMPAGGPHRRAVTTTHTTVSRLATEIEVDLRHNALQTELVSVLEEEFPEEHIHTELDVAGGGRVDVALETDEGCLFCEIKIAPHARAALRQAVGQLIEYTHWPAESRATRWWVVSEPRPTADEISYLKSLRETYGIPLYYRWFDMATGEIGPET